ncbi:MAG: hypothetical protein WEE03_01965 [Chloroflexota bacterium]
MIEGVPPPRARPVRELNELGQSLWLDSLRRQLIHSGELARLRDEGVSGVTTNPAIPGRPYGFATLKAAQALGDLRSLGSRGLPVVRVDLGRSPGAGWRQLTASLERSLS